MSEGDFRGRPVRQEPDGNPSHSIFRIRNRLFFYLAACLLIFVGYWVTEESGLFGGLRGPAIYVSSGARGLESFSASEIQRYLYLRTGRVLPIRRVTKSVPSRVEGVVVGEKDSPIVRSAPIDDPTRAGIRRLRDQEYIIETFGAAESRWVLVAGGDAAGTLYGTYRLAERLGVRFTLAGDVIPDEKIDLKFPDLNEHGKPLFRWRGILPFHDFPEGPDWWNVDDYRAVIGQLPKLGMNFIGLHTYPEGDPYAEPTVWIGLPEDVKADGQVKFSYPARYADTVRSVAVKDNWGYTDRKTSNYRLGASLMFDRDAYGSDVMKGYAPAPKTLEACNAVFDRAGALLNKAFTWAHRLGVKTCVGTETPLVVPSAVKERIERQGRNAADFSIIQDLYKGIFTRIERAYPIDFYWLWTPERWTFVGATREECDATTQDLLTAYRAAKEVGAPFRLATCGWVLGPQYDRSLFDRLLPKDMPMSCINRFQGVAPVDKSFADIHGRDKWAIPWLEDDPALTAPQLWVGRVRRDAADALAYGCDGLMGIHWRTAPLGMNVEALARAGWTQSPWKERWVRHPKTEKEIENGPLSGFNKDYPGNSIAGTDDDLLYQSIRAHVSGYRFQVPNGRYRVTLKFCENVFTLPRMRIFSVTLQGKTVIRNLDIFARVGRYHALDFTFNDVDVEDGRLTIGFEEGIEYTCISAISIEGKDFSEKVNCGGEAYKDYQADWPSNDIPSFPPPTLDFYRDWARHEFGPEAANSIGSLFGALDGKLPRPFEWKGGPGVIASDSRPWKDASLDYALSDQLARYRPLIRGKGNLHRFDNWVHRFRYLKAAGELGCVLGQFQPAMREVETSAANAKSSGTLNPGQVAAMAREQALPLYIRMVGLAKTMEEQMLAVVGTVGEMGTITTLESQTFVLAIDDTGKKLEGLLGKPLPPEARMSKIYEGPPRVFVPTHRTSLDTGENLRLKVIVLSRKSPSAVELHWRPMGRGDYRAVPCSHVARGVYEVQLSAAAFNNGSFEYYVTAKVAEVEVHWPAAAPEINQTVVILPAE